MALLDTDFFLVNRNSQSYKMPASVLSAYVAGATVHVGENPPAEQPAQGDLWWKSDAGILYVYYIDDNTEQWVQAAGGVSGNNDENGASVVIGVNPPNGPSDGDLWWNVEDGRLYIHYTDDDSSQWVDASPAGAGSGEGNTGGPELWISGGSYIQPLDTNDDVRVGDGNIVLSTTGKVTAFGDVDSGSYGIPSSQGRFQCFAGSSVLDPSLHQAFAGYYNDAPRSLINADGSLRLSDTNASSDAKIRLDASGSATFFGTLTNTIEIATETGYVIQYTDVPRYTSYVGLMTNGENYSFANYDSNSTSLNYSVELDGTLRIGGEASDATITLNPVGSGIFQDGLRCSTFRSQRGDNTLTSLLGAFATTDGADVKEKFVIRGDGLYIGSDIGTPDGPSPSNVKMILSPDGDLDMYGTFKKNRATGALVCALSDTYLRLYDTPTNIDDFQITLNTDGSASFNQHIYAGNSGSGNSTSIFYNNSASQTALYIRNYGSAASLQVDANAANNAILVQDNNGNQTAFIKGNGSASFAADNAGITASGGIYTKNQLFLNIPTQSVPANYRAAILEYDGDEKFRLMADGSAHFAGNITNDGTVNGVSVANVGAALTSLKTAAAAATDLDELKTAIATALANF